MNTWLEFLMVAIVLLVMIFLMFGVGYLGFQLGLRHDRGSPSLSAKTPILEAVKNRVVGINMDPVSPSSKDEDEEEPRRGNIRDG